VVSCGSVARRVLVVLATAIAVVALIGSVPSAAATQTAPPRTGTSASQHSSISCRYSTLWALLYRVDGSTETNTGFDLPYTPV
jgi:hypothetical protein